MTSSIARAVVQAKLARMAELLADLDTVGEVDGERLRRDRMLCHAVARFLADLST